MVIFRIQKDSAEDRAGLKDGDAVVAIDGTDVTKLTFREKILKLRGQPGSTAQVHVKGRPAPVALTYTDVSTWK
jgi:C-terminal processing protease CtpA/Prc